jgi:hypothetical protein
MAEGPEGWEPYKRKPDEPERCSFCGRADDNLLFWDGGDAEDPGTPFLACSGCQAWAYRTVLLAGYAAEDI